MIGGAILGGIFRGALGFVAPILAGVPVKAWVILGAVVVAFGAVMFWNHHERAIGEARGNAAIAVLNKTLGEKQTQLEQARSANATCDASVSRLEMDKATCESGRVVDQAAQASTMAERNATEVQLKRDAATSRRALQTMLAGRCKDWANQPACGVTR